jgi:hypothetical protein
LLERLLTTHSDESPPDFSRITLPVIKPDVRFTRIRFPAILSDKADVKIQLDLQKIDNTDCRVIPEKTRIPDKKS